MDASDEFEGDADEQIDVVALDNYWLDLGTWMASEESKPYYAELGRVIAESARLEESLRRAVGMLLGNGERLWAVVNQLSAMQLLNAMRAVAKEGEPTPVTERITAAVRLVDPVLEARNTFAHSDWYVAPFETTAVLRRRKSSPVLEAVPVTREGLVALAQQIHDAADAVGRISVAKWKFAPEPSLDDEP